MSLDLDTTVKGLMTDRAKLIGYIAAIVRDRHLAEDLFQEVVTVAIRKCGEIDDADHLLLWARRVARNKALEARRKRRTTPLTLDTDVLDILDARWQRLDQLDSDAELERLRSCLGKLSPRARQVVDLKFVEGLSGIEISRAVGNKVRSVYVALTRAYRDLEACIRRHRLAEEVRHG